MAEYIIGSSGSDLALAMVGELLKPVERAFPDHSFAHQAVPIIGDGQKCTGPADADAGANRSSTTAIEQVLADGGIDVAVRSLKDVGTANDHGLVLLDPPARADARDALCGSTLAYLKMGARVGTGSPRRAAQLLALRPDIQIIEIHGQVSARPGLMRERELDAVLVAAAGLDRLGLSDLVTERLDPTVFLPAPGQGVLGIQIRDNSDQLEEIFQLFSHPLTIAAARAERRVLADVSSACDAPIGAYAVPDRDGRLHVYGQVTSPDGATTFKSTATGPIERADALGREVAYGLIYQGADQIPPSKK